MHTEYPEYIVVSYVHMTVTALPSVVKLEEQLIVFSRDISTGANITHKNL